MFSFVSFCAPINYKWYRFSFNLLFIVVMWIIFFFAFYTFYLINVKDQLVNESVVCVFLNVCVCVCLGMIKK